jgi:hypothetical protein
LAIGDLDNDGKPEIVAHKYQKLPGCACKDMPIDPFKACCKHIKGKLMAFSVDGFKLWESDEYQGDELDKENIGAPYLADLDADGVTEIIFGNNVFNNYGKLRWSGTAGRGNSKHGAISIAADLDGDGKLEVIAGNTAYRWDGSIYWTVDSLEDGFTAIADLDLDGAPEVILNTYNGVYYISGAGSIIAGPLGVKQAGCCVTAPAVADLDGDGYPEVVITNYLKMIPQYPEDPEIHIMLALNHDGSELWTNNITDETGAAFATVFDFEGDGLWEIVYADEAYVYIIRGDDGEVIYQADRVSFTGSDAPIIVDVDGNRHADLILPLDETPGSIGLRVYFTEPDVWQNARRVWNQQAFISTNINSDLTIPRVPADSWKVHNTFRGQIPICMEPIP